MEAVRTTIEHKIRPALQAHNGDLEFQVTSDGFVKIRLTGACSTCPSSQQTLSEFIETVLLEECPEIKGVIPVFGVSDDLVAEALKILRSERRRENLGQTN